jgi:hypothetical protein
MNDWALMGFGGEIKCVVIPRMNWGQMGKIILKQFVNTLFNHLDLFELL